MILMRPSERSKLLAYVEELSETDRANNTGSGAQNQTFESDTGAADGKISKSA